MLTTGLRHELFRVNQTYNYKKCRRILKHVLTPYIRGVARIFPWGGPKYRFQNFGKCNLGEYPLPLPPPPPPEDESLGSLSTDVFETRTAAGS